MSTFAGSGRPWLQWAIIASLLALSGLAGCREPAARAAEQEPERVIPVTVTHVAEGPLKRTVRAAGVLKEKRELDLSFKVPGVVSRVLVEEGARVRAGQLLAVLDPTEVEAGREQAQEAYLKAERDLTRAQQLHENRGIPKSSLDDAESALVMARASVTTASFNLRHAQLIAPESGVIDTRMVEVGEVVAPGVPVLRFKSGLGSVVRVGLIDRDVLAIKPGQAAEVALDARPGAPIKARVTRVASSITPGLGTFEVELTPVDSQVSLALPSGLSVKVTFAREEEALSLPITSIIDGDGEQAFVYVVENARAKRIPVDLEGIEGERMVLRSKLSPELSVVALGAPELQDGARVRVRGEQ